MKLDVKLKKFFKSAFKRNLISYAEVADELNISEPTVKRLMTQSKMSVSQFEDLCNVLGVSPLEVLSSSIEEPSGFTQLSPDQEDFLYTHPKLDYIFLRLMFGFTIEDIISELGLSKREANHALRQLELYKLIKINKNRKVRVLKKGPFKWRENGPFHLHTKIPFFKSLIKYFAKHVENKRPNYFLSGFELYLTDENHKRLQSDIDELIEKYKKATRLDQSIFPISQLKPYSVIIGLDQYNAWKDFLLSQVKK